MKLAFPLAAAAAVIVATIAGVFFERLSISPLKDAEPINLVMNVVDKRKI
jgi:branched-subunit amino acid ABC-type transport system permease component